MGELVSSGVVTAAESRVRPPWRPPTRRCGTQSSTGCRSPPTAMTRSRYARRSCLDDGAGELLEVVAPDRGTRKHARKRIDHALDASHLRPIGEVVRRPGGGGRCRAAAATVATMAAASG